MRRASAAEWGSGCRPRLALAGPVTSRPYHHARPPAAPPAAPAAAPTVSAGDPARPRGGAAEAEEEEESEEEGVSGVVDVNLLRRRLMADAGFTVSAAEAPQVRPLPLTLTLTPALTLARARARARAQSRCLRPLPRRCGPTLPRGPPEAAVRPRLSSRR